MKIFKSLREVLAHLKKNGYDIGLTTIFRHVNAGMLAKGPDGFSLADVKKYANTNLTKKKKNAPLPSGNQSMGLAERKIEAETCKAEAHAEYWQTKNAQMLGELVPRDEFERQIAARSALFRSDMESFCMSIPNDVVAMVNGDATKIPDLQEFLLRKIANVLGRYAFDPVFNSTTKTAKEVEVDK